MKANLTAELKQLLAKLLVVMMIVSMFSGVMQLSASADDDVTEYPVVLDTSALTKSTGDGWNASDIFIHLDDSNSIHQQSDIKDVLVSYVQGDTTYSQSLIFDYCEDFDLLIVEPRYYSNVYNNN